MQVPYFIVNFYQVFGISILDKAEQLTLKNFIVKEKEII